MNTLFALIGVQALLGAVDNLWHHECTERLPGRKSARTELRLHAARESLYAIVFMGIAWREWLGAWAWVMGLILVAEVVVTLWDFVIEDRTRHLPPSERVLHTLLALNYGVVLAWFAPLLWRWSTHETGLTPVDYGIASQVLTVCAIGVFAWSIRNAIAVLRLSRPAAWIRDPFQIGRNAVPRTILVSGATGFIGGHLVRKLLARGDRVIVLTRDADKALDCFGPHVDIVTTLESMPSNAKIHGIVNLAGAPILGFPWTRARRRKLLDSRVETTNALVRLCSRLRIAPRVLVSGSAIGFYGVRGDEALDETAGSQRIFQSMLCKLWEDAASAACSANVRVVRLRIGLVLSGEGGALPTLALPVRLWMGALIGRGRQWMSWVHIADLVRLICAALDDPRYSGPVNATAPVPVTQCEFYAALGATVRRPVWMRVPAFLLRILLGDMAQLLADGQRVVPAKALRLGFEFKHRSVQDALRAIYAPRQAFGDELEIYYNGACPVCDAEMTHYSRIARRHELPLRFIDAIVSRNQLASCGLRREHLERRVYIRDERGRIRSGLGAILILWRQLPGYRWLARVVGLPIIRSLGEHAYDHVIAPTLAWWANRRLRREPVSQSR